MKNTGDYYVVVVEDTGLRQIVATATLITEHKFIHSCAKVRTIKQQNQLYLSHADARNVVTSLGSRFLCYQSADRKERETP